MKSNWQTWLKLYFGTGCFLVLILAASAAPQKKAKPPGSGSANSALTQPAATPSRPTGGGQWENFPLPGSFIMALDRGDGKGFGLLAYDAIPRRARQMDLPRHLPRGRQPGGPMEPARQRNRAGINPNLKPE